MLRSTCLLLVLVAFCTNAAQLFERFDEGWAKRWQHSKDAKYGGEFEVDTIGELEDPALKVPTKAQFYGISGLVDSPVDPTKGLALQFELKLEDSQYGCGGAYLKFLTADKTFTPTGLKDDTPYTVMFGPDRCGSTNKVHFIIRHKNPKTGTIEEKHMKGNPIMASGTETHVYTAILRPDNTYSILIDGKESKTGSLFDDFEPPFLPPKEIDDPEDSKPADWVDEAKIADPDAKKPDDWDEDAPRMIPDEDAQIPDGWLEDEPTEVPDETAEKPEDWDDEEDGEWEASLVPNPKCASAPGCGPWQRPTKPNPDYKGKWTAPVIDNPAYKGPWAPRKIPNPEYHEDKEPLKHIGNIGAAAIEIWTMESGYSFDNIVVTNDEAEAAEIRDKYWQPKHDAESKAKARKEADAKIGADQPLHKRITLALVNFVDSQPALVQYRDQLAPLYVAMDQSAPLVYMIVGVPAALTLFVVYKLLARLTGGGKKTDKAAIAKKTDAPTPDAPAANGSSIADAAARAAGVSEIEEEPQDEDQGVRRRSRREH